LAALIGDGEFGPVVTAVGGNALARLIEGADIIAILQ
jgi:hypothetical protein